MQKENILTLILELAVDGLPFLSMLRLSGNKLRMKSLKQQIQEKSFLRLIGIKHK